MADRVAWRSVAGWLAVAALGVVGLAAHAALRSVLGSALPALLIPVIGAAAWMGGARAGFVVGAAIVPLRVALWAILGLGTWADLVSLPLLVGVLALSLMGGGMGWLRDLSETARHARAEMEALLDAIDESVIRYAADGRVLWVNRAGRQRFLDYWGRIPTSTADVGATAGAQRPTPGERALAGETSTGEYAFADSAGRTRRFSVRAVPIRNRSGEGAGAVSVWHDVTELHEAVAALAQYDGAAKTVRRVLHEMGNALAPARGYSELLGRVTPEQAGEFLAEIRESVARASEVLDQLGAVVRIAESEFGGEVMLDLAAAADPSEDSTHATAAARDGKDPS